MYIENAKSIESNGSENMYEIYSHSMVEPNYGENDLDKKTPLLFCVAPQFILAPQKIRVILHSCGLFMHVVLLRRTSSIGKWGPRVDLGSILAKTYFVESVRDS